MKSNLASVNFTANKQNKVAAERKSRRALGDIGNLIPADGAVEGKPIPRISRPVTRYHQFSNNTIFHALTNIGKEKMKTLDTP